MYINNNNNNNNNNKSRFGQRTKHHQTVKIKKITRLKKSKQTRFTLRSSSHVAINASSFSSAQNIRPINGPRISLSIIVHTFVIQGTTGFGKTFISTNVFTFEFTFGIETFFTISLGYKFNYDRSCFLFACSSISSRFLYPADTVRPVDIVLCNINFQRIFK